MVHFQIAPANEADPSRNIQETVPGSGVIGTLENVILGEDAEGESFRVHWVMYNHGGKVNMIEDGREYNRRGFRNGAVVRLPIHPTLGMLVRILLNNDIYDYGHTNVQGINEYTSFLMISAYHDSSPGVLGSSTVIIGGNIDGPATALQLFAPKRGDFIELMGNGTAWIVQSLGGNWSRYDPEDDSVPSTSHDAARYDDEIASEVWGLE